MADIKQTGFANTFKSDPNGTTGVSTNTSTALDNLGTIMVQRDATYGMKAYMYVQAVGAIAAGSSCVMTSSPYVVASNGTLGIVAAKTAHQKVIGVAPVALTTAYYGWIQIRGHCTKILASPKTSTQASNWALYSSGGVYSMNRLNTCACNPFTNSGIFTYTAVASGKSTSGFIACW